jgi:cytochrome c6
LIIALFLLAQAGLPTPAPVAKSSLQETWERRCTVCHAAEGTGKTPKGRSLKAPDFTSARWQKHTTDQEIVDAITNGVPKRKMPAFKDKLSEEDIRAFVPYLRALAAK